MLGGGVPMGRPVKVLLCLIELLSGGIQVGPLQHCDQGGVGGLERSKESQQ